MNQTPDVYGIMLASGFSRRMGRQKLLLPLEGETIFDHVIKKSIESKLQGIYVVIPDVDNTRKKIAASYNVCPVWNKNPYLGMGHSLSLGVKSLPKNADGAMVLLADQPEMSLEDINKVYDYFCNHFQSEKSKLIIQTGYQHNKTGHPVLFSQHFFQKLSDLRGDKGGKQIIKDHIDFVTYAKSNNDYPQDIDTPKDYASLIDREWVNIVDA